MAYRSSSKECKSFLLEFFKFIQNTCSLTSLAHYKLSFNFKVGRVKFWRIFAHFEWRVVQSNTLAPRLADLPVSLLLPPVWAAGPLTGLTCGGALASYVAVCGDGADQTSGSRGGGAGHTSGSLVGSSKDWRDERPTWRASWAVSLPEYISMIEISVKIKVQGNK